MFISLIITTLMVLNVGEAAQYCFDDAQGTIYVTMTVDDRLSIRYSRWKLTWKRCLWSKTCATRGFTRKITAQGCCTKGMFKLGNREGQFLSFSFMFEHEQHVMCYGEKPRCSFPAMIHERDGIYYVAGILNCFCVPDNIEVGDMAWEDFDTNATYNATIESINILEYEHRLN